MVTVVFVERGHCLVGMVVVDYLVVVWVDLVVVWEDLVFADYLLAVDPDGDSSILFVIPASHNQGYARTLEYIYSRNCNDAIFI